MIRRCHVCVCYGNNLSDWLQGGEQCCITLAYHAVWETFLVMLLLLLQAGYDYGVEWEGKVGETEHGQETAQCSSS